MDNKQSNIVMHFLNGLAVGGIENLALQLLHHSPHHLEDILVNFNSDCVEMLAQFQAVPQLKIIDIPYQGEPKIQFVFQLTKMLKQYHPQAIFIYPFGIIHILIAVAGRLASVPKIAVHAGNPPPQDVFQRYKWKILVQASRWLGVSIHCCSQTVHQQFQSLGRFPKGSFPIPNGCNVENIAQRASRTRQQRLHSQTIIIGMVARLNAIKDHETLIRAFAIVQKQFPNTTLWIIGEGDEKPKLQNLARELELNNQLVFWGNRSDVPELLGQMDIYVFSTTINEGFGIALIEAIAKLPIIATDVAACREVLANGKAGLLVPPKNPEALANTLYRLFESQQQRIAWGEKGFAHSLSYYSSQACAQQWYNLLKIRSI